RQGKLDNVAKKGGHLYPILFGYRLDHKIWTVADISHCTKENGGSGNGHQFKSRLDIEIQRKIPYLRSVIDIGALGSHGCRQKIQISWGVVQNRREAACTPIKGIVVDQCCSLGRFGISTDQF